MQPATFFDTHAHLDDKCFDIDRREVIQRANAAGIVKIVNVGTDLASSRKVISLAEEHPELYAVAGWHPSHAHEAPADIRTELRQLAHHPKVVALGETGLDYHWLPSRTDKTATPASDMAHKAKQAELLAQHLEVAAETGLSLVIHQRESFDDMVKQLTPWVGKVRGVFHCFSEGPERLAKVLELGFIVSFTGIVTFKNADKLRESVAKVPDNAFMLETDSPYMAPIPHRGKRCEPAFVANTAEAVANVRGTTLQTLSQLTSSTAHLLFPKMNSQQIAK